MDQIDNIQYLSNINIIHIYNSKLILTTDFHGSYSTYFQNSTRLIKGTETVRTY